MTQAPNMSPGDAGQTPQPGDPPGQTPPPQSQTQSGQLPTQQQQRTSTDHWTEEDREYIRRLRKEAETANDQLKALQRQEQEAEEERQKKRGEFQKLAEKHEQRVKELEPIATRYTALASLMKGHIDAQIKDWPEAIKTFDPGPDADVETRLAWMEKARPHVDKFVTQQRGLAPGNSPNPPQAGGDISQRDIEEHLRRGRESGKHRIF